MSMTKRILPVVLLALGLVAPGAARADLEAKGVMLCAMMEAVDCDPSGVCSSGLPRDVNLPGIVQLDFDKKKMTILDQARRGESTEMQNLTVRDGRIVVQGFQARAFSIQIGQKSGGLTAAVADEGRGFLVFGTCVRP